MFRVRPLNNIKEAILKLQVAIFTVFVVRLNNCNEIIRSQLAISHKENSKNRNTSDLSNQGLA